MRDAIQKLSRLCCCSCFLPQEGQAQGGYAYLTSSGQAGLVHASWQLTACTTLSKVEQLGSS